VVENALDICDDGPKREPVTEREYRWQGSVFRSRAMIARSKGDCDKPGWITGRNPRRKSDLDRLAARQVHAA
jgi:hypothetical protein